MNIHDLMVVSNVLNFGILAAILWKFAIPRVSEMISAKQEAISQALDEADKHLTDVEAQLAEVRREMQQAEAEIGNIRKEAEARGIEAAAKIKADTQQEIEQLRQRVERQIQQEFSNLSLRLRQDLIAQVILKAEALLKGKLEADKNLQTQLIENFAFSLKGFKEYKS